MDRSLTVRLKLKMRKKEEICYELKFSISWYNPVRPFSRNLNDILLLHIDASTLLLSYTQTDNMSAWI